MNEQIEGLVNVVRTSRQLLELADRALRAAKDKFARAQDEFIKANDALYRAFEEYTK